MMFGMTMGEGDAGGRLFPRGLDGVDPITAVLLADARRALAAYPELVGAGALFTSAEEVPGGWRLVRPLDPLPQGARELLAGLLDDEALVASPDAAGELRAAARELRRRPADEVSAAGRRFRIVRVEQLIRTGPDGPEPPRPTDLDTGDARPHAPDLLPVDGPPPDLAAELLCQVLDAGTEAGREPSGDHLTPVTLAPAFTLAERNGGRWRPAGRLHAAPEAAREALVTYLRHVVPVVEDPDPADAAAYAEAADLMADGTRRNGVAAAGRRFRVVRIERVTLLGPDGPEPPRPADVDAR